MNRHCESTPPSTASGLHSARRAKASPDSPHRKQGIPSNAPRNGPQPRISPAAEAPARKEQSQSGRIPSSESQGRLPGPEPATRPTWHGIPSDQLQESLAPDQALAITLPQLRVLGQSASTYIVADHAQGLCLLDQHAAHERVIYDKLQAAAKKGPARVQKMLVPITTTLSSQQSDMAREYGELLERYGFTLTTGENGQWTILTVPAVMVNQAGSPEEMLTNLLDELAFETVTTEFEKALAATIACHSAVRAGDHLTVEEMESIIQQLADTHDPHTCPHGRPTSLQLRNSHIEMEFRRR